MHHGSRIDALLRIVSVVAAAGIAARTSLGQSVGVSVATTRPDSASLLQDLLPAAGADRNRRGLGEIARMKDRRFTAPLIDLLRFKRSGPSSAQVSRILRDLTQCELKKGEEAWEVYMSWYGAREDCQPPPGYAAWKGDLMGQMVDPRFRDFLHDDVDSSIRLEEIAWGGVEVDGIPALVNPRMIPANDAGYLTDDEAVFGVSLNGEQRAYPLRILDWHEMANDIAGGRPVALSWCTLCGAAILFDATVDGRPLVFGSSGLLFRSNKLMYDRETKSLWSQMTGEPVVGPLVGRGIKLRILPIVTVSWGDWKRLHPDTRVLDIKTGYDRPYRIGAYYGRYFGSSDLMFPVWKQDRRLERKARVFAIEIDGKARAYGLEALQRLGGPVNDTFAGQPLVIVHHDTFGRFTLPDAWRDALRELGGHTAEITDANQLTLDAARAALASRPDLIRGMSAEFLLAMPVAPRLTLLAEWTADSRPGARPRGGKLAPELRDLVAQRGLIGETRAYRRGPHTFAFSADGRNLVDERGRLWQVTEEALTGPDGSRLDRLGGHLAYWFAWYAFHPGGDLFTPKDGAEAGATRTSTSD